MVAHTQTAVGGRDVAAAAQNAVAAGNYCRNYAPEAMPCLPEAAAGHRDCPLEALFGRCRECLPEAVPAAVGRRKPMPGGLQSQQSAARWRQMLEAGSRRDQAILLESNCLLRHVGQRQVHRN